MNEIIKTQASDQDVKNAARLLCQRLAKDGIQVKQSLALEAIAASFGVANWRTLKAKLDVPAKPKFEGPRYLVEAIYTDNDQQYGDHVDADDPLEAAIYVMLERLTDFGNEVAISSVEDRETGKTLLSPDYLHELDLVPMHEAIQTVCKLARARLGVPPERDVEAADRWDRLNLAIRLWEHVAQQEQQAIAKAMARDESFSPVLDAVATDYDFVEQYGSGDAITVCFTDDRGVEFEVVPVEELDRLLDAVRAGPFPLDWDKLDSAKTTGRFQLTQVHQALEMHGNRFNTAAAMYLPEAE